MQCPICTDKIKDIIELECSHSFCRECIREWFKQKHTCPVCRAPSHKFKDIISTGAKFDFDEYNNINDNTNDSINDSINDSTTDSIDTLSITFSDSDTDSLSNNEEYIVDLQNHNTSRKLGSYNYYYYTPTNDYYYYFAQ